MPDTGAPWNIPYVDDSDLVRDFPTADEAQALAIAAGLDDAYVIAQVAQTVKTDTFSTTSVSYVDVTGLAATITPSRATSKVLIIAHVSQGDWSQGSFIQIVGGNADSYVGDAATSRVRAAGWVYGGGAADGNQVNAPSQVIAYLDSPATTSPVTYKVQLRAGVNTTGVAAYINRSHADSNSAAFGRLPSSLTLIEVIA
jgi:hypothetical protein